MLAEEAADWDYSHRLLVLPLHGSSLCTLTGPIFSKLYQVLLLGTESAPWEGVRKHSLADPFAPQHPGNAGIQFVCAPTSLLDP